jgi:hypothetical protein
MNKTDYRNYLASVSWRELREILIAERDGFCQRCNMPRWLAAILYDQDMHVHHLHYQSLGHECPDDVQILCRRCHDLETFGRSDYPALKSSICTFCQVPHFDPYSDTCAFCSGILYREKFMKETA